jgi:type I restriction enzyme S subunit
LKRIKLLEEMAQITYEEWFVRMKFPGHETAVFDEETGLPEGWKKEFASNLFNIKIGKTPPRGEVHWFNTSTSLKWISIKDMRNSNLFIFNSNETIDEKAISKFNFNIAEKDTVILSFKLAVGLISIVTENMVTNEAIAHFNTTKDTPLFMEYTYLFLKNFNYDTMGSTSSIGTAINSKIVKRIPFLVPDAKTLLNFKKIIEPIFISLKNLQIQNQRLKEARDILLPRLMTGMIDVDEIEVEL